MIPVVPADEPDDFDAQVRQKGATFLAGVEAGKKPKFKGKEFWRHSLSALHTAYGGICSYTCHFIPFDTGADTVEHFRPKDLYPGQAYEWANFRLVCARLNARKGVHEDVLDPFTIGQGTFLLDFPSLQILPAEGLDEGVRARAESTIERLKLNDERTIKARLRYVIDLRDGLVDFALVARDAPFIASEIVRQGLADQLAQVMTDEM
jgi:hypothetical protein